MTAIRIDGKVVAQRRREQCRVEASRVAQSIGRAPALAVVLVGDDPASHVYVRNKHRACAEAGVDTHDVRLPDSCSSRELRAAVERINEDDTIDGLLVQLPVPDAIDPAEVRGWIDPSKDVDGLHPENVGLLASGTPRFVPCTPAGCLELLREYDIPTAGREAVVIGRSLIVGRPMATLLSTKGVDATVTMGHSRSGNLKEICQRADILVVAAGQAEMVEPDWVKPGAAVIDVGIHRIADASRPRGSRLVGDVAPAVGEVAGHLTPVPGGVGPMTIAMLLQNTVEAAGRKA